MRFSHGDAQHTACRETGPESSTERRIDFVKQGYWILAVLLSHWRRHPLQLTTLMVGLISATALWSGVEALNQQARTSYDRAAAVFGGSRPAMLVGQRDSPFSQQVLALSDGR